MSQRPPKDTNNTNREGGKSLRSALDPIVSDSSPSTFAVLKSWGGGGSGSGGKDGGDGLLHDMAPLIMTPKFISAAAASSSRNTHHNPYISSSSSSSSTRAITSQLAKVAFPSFPRRSTSTSLGILEVAPLLLSQPIPDAPSDNASGEGVGAGGVSFLRGFQATVPSSEKGKERRRKVRGDVADVGFGKAGVKGLLIGGGKERGLLMAEEADTGDTGGRGAQVGMTGKERRKRRREKAEREGKGGGTANLGQEELMKMREEIGWDKENLVVRKSILSSEVREVQNKIAALESIRSELEDGILKLKEEDLELEDELEGINDRLHSLLTDPTMIGSGGGGDQAHASSSTSARRRKGPAFLPSEHDDLPPGVAFMTLDKHTGSITALDFSEPYGTLVTASADESVRVWDLCSGEEVGYLRGHEGIVKTIQVDDQLCLTGGSDGNIKLWDLRRVEDYEDILSDRAQNDGSSAERQDAMETVIRGSGMMTDGGDEEGEGGASVMEDGTNPCLRTLEGHSKAVTSLYYEDGCLVTGSSDKTIRQWDVQTGQCVLTMDILWAISNPPPPLPSQPEHPSHPHYRSPSSSSFDSSSSSPYYDPYPSSGMSGHNMLLNVTSAPFGVPTPPYADGSWEMYGDFVGGVQFWGYALASGSGDGGVRMWDMRTGQAHRTLIGHTGPVTCLQFDEMHVISGSLDKTIRIWDLRTGSVSDVLKYEYPVTALQFDTRKIIAATGENGIKNYNRTSHQTSSLTTNGHVLPAERIRYQDKYLVSGGKDTTVKVWSL